MCCAVLYCTVLYCATLCCAALRCAALRCAALCSAPRTALHSLCRCSGEHFFPLAGRQHAVVVAVKALEGRRKELAPRGRQLHHLQRCGRGASVCVCVCMCVCAGGSIPSGRIDEGMHRYALRPTPSPLQALPAMRLNPTTPPTPTWSGAWSKLTRCSTSSHSCRELS